MIQVPDAASVAAARHLFDLAGLHAGPSTGTNLWGVWQLAAAMEAEGKTGSIVSLMCDSGDRYEASYGNNDWLASRGLDPAPAQALLAELFATGRWPQQ
jgi:cysteine synthase A